MSISPLIRIKFLYFKTGDHTQRRIQNLVKHPTHSFPMYPFSTPPENIRKPYRLGNGGKTLAILAKSSILMFDMVVNTPRCWIEYSD